MLQVEREHVFCLTKTVCVITYKKTCAGRFMEILKGKCALGPFLSILVIKCQHKCLNVNLCPWMNKVQI
jgi:hypothetical protein